MKVIVTGSRTWTDEDFIERVLATLLMLGPGDTLVHGAAEGADQIAATIAGEELGCEVIPLPVEEDAWKMRGRVAGLERNDAILDQHGDADLVVAFHISGTTGTADMIRKARHRQHEVWTFWKVRP